MPLEKETFKITKEIARRSMLSRRSAEKAILEGRIRYNNEETKNPALRVEPNANLELDGHKLSAREIDSFNIYAYFKPRGLVVSHYDKHNDTIFNHIAEKYSNLKPVGRLDVNSEGLLLLSDNGEIARKLEISRAIRQYTVRIFSSLNDLLDLKEEMESIKEGKIEIDGEYFYPINIIIDQNLLKEDRHRRTNYWVNVNLVEGKNREIRKIFQYKNIMVNRLIRIAYGGFAIESFKDTIAKAKNQMKKLTLTATTQQPIEIVNYIDLYPEEIVKISDKTSLSWVDKLDA